MGAVKIVVSAILLVTVLQLSLCSKYAKQRHRKILISPITEHDETLEAIEHDDNHIVHRAKRQQGTGNRTGTSGVQTPPNKVNITADDTANDKMCLILHPCKSQDGEHESEMKEYCFKYMEDEAAEHLTKKCYDSDPGPDPKTEDEVILVTKTTPTDYNDGKAEKFCNCTENNAQLF